MTSTSAQIRKCAAEAARFTQEADDGRKEAQACEERAATALIAAKEAERAAAVAAVTAEDVAAAWCAASIENGFLSDEAEGASLLEAIRVRAFSLSRSGARSKTCAC